MGERILRSTAEIAIAKIDMAKANGNGYIRIEPCIQVVDGKEVICPNLTREKDQSLCNYPDGIIYQNGRWDCPKQWGTLRLVNIEKLI